MASYPEGMRYLVRQRIISFAASFWITDEDGNEVFHVDGQALQLRKTFELKDRSGAVVAMIRQQLFIMWNLRSCQTFRNIASGDSVSSSSMRAGRCPVGLKAWSRQRRRSQPMTDTDYSSCCSRGRRAGQGLAGVGCTARLCRHGTTAGSRSRDHVKAWT
jgi:LURP-one-related